MGESYRLREMWRMRMVVCGYWLLAGVDFKALVACAGLR